MRNRVRNWRSRKKRMGMYVCDFTVEDLNYKKFYPGEALRLALAVQALTIAVRGDLTEGGFPFTHGPNFTIANIRYQE